MGKMYEQEVHRHVWVKKGDDHVAECWCGALSCACGEYEAPPNNRVRHGLRPCRPYRELLEAMSSI